MPPFSRFTALTEQLPASVPFVGPEVQERQAGTPFMARLGANESGFGPAPSVIAAITEASATVWRYGDSESFDLCSALARRLDLPCEQIIVGEGIDSLLGLTVRLVVETGTPVVTSLGAYPTFNYHVTGYGGRLVTVPYRDDREDLEALRDAVLREDAPLVYLANPDNPMGSWHSADAVTAFARSLPDTTLLVLDEAYGEFAPDGVLPPVSDLAQLPNVLRYRTFSKAHGLAGLRVGYVFGTAETVARFHRVRNHFGVNRLGQVAARAALEDAHWLDHVRAQVAAALQRLAQIAEQNDLQPLPSATNFLAIDCGSAVRARSILEGLNAHRVFIRMPGVAPLDRCIRVSAGPASELDAFEKALPTVLAGLT
ncbi:pyridoxal phosphate-dependent aminotransferase [Pseudohoeflea coraliihabitans]|uniref:histidinol-phosphate transaminase n=1 Tax=Pseudohoeflea coraliihabitans TaxID=2860393 RepID=A0ABS6WIE2_9HYPH|nr:pyridoxal phosphate-dependent aminotransferase [Pseudohoeflea sp. DP4N28-3]MBW3095719.1 pyridoxal phosphate-dependent aminotransferase [Pseudohoeflea sp. DP4N28-3]